MRTEGAKLIGRVDCDYYFADSVFKHGDGFSGVTGFVVRPVSSEELEWASDEENVAERYEDFYDELFNDEDCEGCGGRPDPDTGCDECGAPDILSWVRQLIFADGIGHLMFDDSFGSAASDAFDYLDLEHEYTDCSGCGRIFGRFGGAEPIGFDEVFDRAGYEAAIAYEDGTISYEFAALTIFGRVDHRERAQ